MAVTTNLNDYNKWDKIINDLDDNSDSDDDDNKAVSKQQELMEQKMMDQHLRDIENTKLRFCNGQYQFIQSLIDDNAANHVCTRALNKLRRISIWQLKPNTIHYGYKLIAKIISAADKLLSFRCIIKDIENHKNGRNVIQLSIYNLIPFQISLSQIEQSKILSKNTIIIIKEPYCKFYKSNEIGIRIDNPMYNITISKQNKKNNKNDSIQTLKQSGNTYFKQNKYWKAITFYSKAIQLIQQNQNNDGGDDDDNIKMKLLLNRSLSYLKLNEYNLAYIDAQNAFSINPSCIKVQYRYLSCLTYIGEHQKALSIINGMDLNEINCVKTRKQFINLAATINRRYNEWIGKFDTNSYQLMADDKKYECVVDYIGNIQIEMINKTKGRGIIATKDIKCGQLILVEKAFSFGCYYNDNDNDNDNDNKQQTTFIQTFNNENKRVYSGRNQELILNTISKCFPFNYKDYCYDDDDDEGDMNEYDSIQCLINKWRLLQLYDGNSVKNTNMNIEYLFDKQLIINGMDDDKMDKMRKEIISAKTVTDIILNNAFETLMKPENIEYFLNESDGDNFDLIKNERYCGSGLWIIASLFNHCHEPNAKRFVYYKTMFIVSQTNIQKGQEITISYVDQTMSKFNKCTQLKNWGIS